LSFLGLVGCAIFGLAQSPAELFEKAPPHVDEALRARIRKFYQAHVDGKFRLADEVVAEDSKDAFFAAEKPRYRDFEIVKIAYSDNFTEAAVLVTCGGDLLLGSQVLQVKRPVSSHWKLMDGQWYWYLRPNTERRGPFGVPFPPRDAGSSGPSSSAPPPPHSPPDLAAIMAGVVADKAEVRLRGEVPGSDSLIVTNRMPGTVRLALESTAVPGLDIQLSRKELKAGEQARVFFYWEPAGKVPASAATVRLTVDPTGQIIPIRVIFAVSPDAGKPSPN
jgi:hypothetical protein